MVQQKIFNFNFSENYSFEYFFVSDSNIDAYNLVLSISNSLNSIILKGPAKSGKTHLGSVWQKKNNALKYCNNHFKDIINQNKKGLYLIPYFNNTVLLSNNLMNLYNVET